MSQRVRERGPRRRCSSNRTLVRTIPGLQKEPPPVPLINGSSRHYSWAEIADYEGLATAAWSSNTISASSFSSLYSRPQNVLYHHFTVANTQTDSYSAILPPLRFSPMAPSSDGGSYDAFVKPNTTGPFANVHRSFFPVGESIEVSPAALPADSHCEFPDGYTQISYIDPVFPTGTGGPVGTSYGSNTANLDAIAPTTYIAPGTIREVYAARIRVNGSPVGSLLMSGAALRSERITYTKGDVIEWDVWYRIRYLPVSSSSPAPGKGVIFVPMSYVTSTAVIPTVVTFRNLDTVPLFDIASHTYEVTIAGHTGWTLKGGSNGPHKIENDGLWTRQPYTTPDFGSGVRWMYGSSFATLWIRTDREVPSIRFQPGSLVGAIFGYTPGESYYYRPTNGGSTGYRKSTTKKIVYNTNGGTNSIAETVDHAPSGVWDQAGTTIFDRIEWNDSLLTYVPGKGSGISPSTTASWIPTAITLARVPL